MRSQKLKFTNPPVEEVVFDLHFERLNAIQFDHLSEFRDLYKSDFPNVQEMPLLPPSIENFEALPQRQNIAFSVGDDGSYPRLWFLVADDATLIQVQPDRFIYNWRKREGALEYPSYSTISPLFRRLALRFSLWVEEELRKEFRIQQIELRYINSISNPELKQLDEIFSFFPPMSIPLEGLQLSLIQPIHDGFNKKIGRVVTELNSSRPDIHVGFNHWLSLTGTSKPESENLVEAMKSIDFVHDVLIDHFMTISTDRAKAIWAQQIDG